MYKVICLSPCLMQVNTRKINHKSMSFNFETFKFDDYVVCAQCFDESDYDPRFHYIVNSKEKLGWVKSRNELLKYFYNSDADYAFWIDANSTVSKSSINDVLTIIDYLRRQQLSSVDAIFSTLGMWICNDRIDAKKSDDYLDCVSLIPAKKNRSYNWMHGLFIKNFKKYYDEEIYIDENCDTLQGLPEDVYFARLLRQLKLCYVAPTVIITKPNSKGSTQWAQQDGKYNYPPVKFNDVDQMIIQNIVKHMYTKNGGLQEPMLLYRVEDYRNLLKPYSAKQKSCNYNNEPQKINLF